MIKRKHEIKTKAGVFSGLLLSLPDCTCLHCACVICHCNLSTFRSGSLCFGCFVVADVPLFLFCV